MWEDLAFPQLTQSVHLAVGPTKIMLALLMVCLIGGFGLLLDWLMPSVTVNPQAGQAFYRIEGPDILSQPNELRAYIEAPEAVDTYILKYEETGERQGVFQTLWHFTASLFNNATTRLLELGESNIFANLKNVFKNLWLGFRALVWAIQFHPVYSLVFFSFSVLVTCFFGGGICRCAALEFARRERPGLVEAIQYSWEQFRSLLSAPLLPAGILVTFASMVILIGWAGNLPRAGELLIAGLFPALLLVGLLMALLVFASLAGATLLFPAVVYEGTTGRDAIGRSFCYVLGKPLWMVFYTLAEIVLGTLFYLFIRLLVFVVLRITYALLSWGLFPAAEGAGKLARIWTKPSFFYFLNQTTEPANWSEAVAAGVIYAVMLLLVGVVLALVISFVFSSTTILYGLMRKKVDRVEIDRVDLHLEKVAAVPLK